jgi:hypothetical protein
MPARPRVLTEDPPVLADIVPFPKRRSTVVWLVRDGPGWLVIANGHGWLFGSRREAEDDAQWLSCNLGLPIRAVASP